MKIQDLAIIFVLIILPISLVLSAYTQYQIQTLSTQTLYDTQLTAATYDAIKAYQINAENSTTSELSNSKIRDIEASVSTFKNSIISSFRLNGYSEEELDNYIPALVYTMYDGFYIYSPYENVNYQYEEKKDASGNTMTDANGDVIYDKTKPKQGNGENIYGLKPYISYSCRYKKGTIDVIITYALDNYIKIQGTTNGIDYVNERGYLIDGIRFDTSTNKVYYNDIPILSEQLKEYFIGSSELGISAGVYPYVKLNDTKYYLVGDKIIYLSNGTPRVQCKDTGKLGDEYSKYKALIENNNQAIQYYKNAKEFTDKVRSTTGLNLTELTYGDAYDVDGNTKLWPGNTTKIFTDTKNIENELSNFNQHRLEVIRHTIETNLSLAIANYNNYSKSTTNDFQMPKLKEDEWDYITHNISLISFLQGLNIGGKIYNGYTIVTNSESKEVVLESNIYILGQDSSGKKTYHNIGDTELENKIITANVGSYSGIADSRSAGRINLDFRRKSITDNNNAKYYYPLQDYNASYTSVIMQDKVNDESFEDIYEYIKTECDDNVKLAFYTALGRERQGKYNNNNISDITPTTCTITYNANGGSGEPTSQSAIYLTPIQLSTQVPTREGYKFEGWAKDPNTSVVQYQPGNVIIAEDMTLYAVWSKIVTITYNANGGTGAPASQTAIAGTNIQLSAQVPTRPGYKFEGWSRYSSTHWAEYQPGTWITAEDMTLYAIWSKYVTITYNANGGTGAPASQTAIDGTMIQLSTQVPTRPGYKFEGWSRYSSTQLAEYQPGTWITAEDMTLYAIWSKYVTITYNANGGTRAPASQTAIAGTNIQLSTQIPTRPGYVFVGWSRHRYPPSSEWWWGWSEWLEEWLVDYKPGTWIRAENMTLYAVWKYNGYPYIPTGFIQVAGTNLSNGFTIQDRKGNQYVWVEVPKTTEVYPTAGLNITTFTANEYTKIENDLHTYTVTYKDGTTAVDQYYSDEITGLTSAQYTQLKQKMLKSVYQNGGFYVGRYEAGIDYNEGARTEAGDTTQTPVIKQNAYPYNHVTTRQAQELSERFATEGYTSSLMFGVQWDLIMKYLETKGVGQDELITDSRSWGNYLESTYRITNTSAKYSNDRVTWKDGAYGTKSSGTEIHLTTGASEDFCKQNIYDLAGNMWEMSLEYSTNTSFPIVVKGGSAIDVIERYAARRNFAEGSLNGINKGFRVALYKDEGILALEPTYIPEGYTHVEGTTMENGYVVEDTKGNQYVWVEVPKTTEVYRTAGLNITTFTANEYTKIENDLHDYTSVYRNGTPYKDTYYSDDVTGLTEKQYNELKQKMLKSVYQNGGFYVGKYETGIEGIPRTSGSSSITPTQTPVIKQNAYPYNFVTCKQAQSLASKMESGEYTSSLMFGVQWNLVLKYLETKGATQDELNSDSTNWGNYYNNNWTISNANSKYYYNARWTNGLYNGTGSKGSTSKCILLSTGASDDFSKQGIYDLAGNVSEWTLEWTSHPFATCAERGGNYYDDGDYALASDHVANYKTSYYDFLGFRVSLF